MVIDMEKIKCTYKEATELKVRIGNLIDCFPTGRIRGKDMDKFNEELNAIMSSIIDESSATFGPYNEQPKEVPNSSQG
jgi:hypothetical protein